MQFNELGLDKRLLANLEHKGFNQVTEIQHKAIPIGMVGKDLLASSKTGSGKTLAYLLPMMHRLMRNKALSRQDARALILTPTRELAKQVYGELKLLLSTTNLKAVLIVGGENFNDQAKALSKDPQIIIATPGRVADHLDKRHFYLNGLEMLILDEADRMLDLGFEKQLAQISKAADHRKRQTMMFSATLDHSDLSSFSVQLLKDPERVAIGAAIDDHGDISQSCYFADNLDHKKQLLDKLIADADINQAIIFCATREDTDTLAQYFNDKGVSAIALSGKLLQSQRNTIMDGFSRGQQKILVTTDLASRGLDITQVSHVINFDMPKHPEEYIHRIGRTGRAGSKGQAFSLIGPKDWHNFQAVEKFLGKGLSFDSIAELPAKFKGLAPKKEFTKSLSKSKATQPAVKGNTSTARPKAKRKKTFTEGIDVGFTPIKKMPKRQIIEDDD
ncbi:DEAD/DEAH box helicase [Paraferrimonas sp. SM1919]|uniref:DEAD/DEAH box helicase n=1 Tax=Paraferrimonas sp. SM1919 TaxID=2662263 RepID=UPI0013D24980|nr:DEAD/DEAH box helicase [Paraferrimonas sp. SM1919]